MYSIYISIPQNSENRNPFLEYSREGFVLDFCSTFWILSFVTFRKNLRSPFQNNHLGCFVHCVRIPIYILTKKQESTLQRGCFSLFWRRERDSNPRVLAHKLISSHRALIPFSASTCLFLPNFARFRPIFQDLLSKSPQK